MQEQLISFECAKLAKEKGFDWKTTSRYQGEDLIFHGALYNSNNEEENSLWNVELISVPTQSLLQKWLRDEKRVNIQVLHEERGNWSYGCGFGYTDSLGGYMDYDSYESALEAGLIEALKLI